MDYFKFNNDMPAQKGSLLISEPFLPDPNFERTVILLCEHNDDGSFGFVLNKPSEVLFEEVMNDIDNFKERIFIGGPVEQQTLHFIHRAPYLEGGVDIGNGLWWGGNFEQLIALIEAKQINASDFRFFVGYSGWSPGQLEEELSINSWIVAGQATSSLIFDVDSTGLWKTVLKQMGGRYSIYSNYPTDPRLN